MLKTHKRHALSKISALICMGGAERATCFRPNKQKMNAVHYFILCWTGEPTKAASQSGSSTDLDELRLPMMVCSKNLPSFWKKSSSTKSVFKKLLEQICRKIQTSWSLDFRCETYSFSCIVVDWQMFPCSPSTNVLFQDDLTNSQQRHIKTAANLYLISSNKKPWIRHPINELLRISGYCR